MKKHRLKIIARLVITFVVVVTEIITVNDLLPLIINSNKKSAFHQLSVTLNTNNILDFVLALVGLAVPGIIIYAFLNALDDSKDIHFSKKFSDNFLAFWLSFSIIIAIVTSFTVDDLARSSPKCWCKLNSANLSFHKLKHTGFF
ncbi:hypothetical protein [Limosilactobacillus fermentum]|uniref:hypothetical protein n=1 Tax=Limosilactobacillus fermentum TaxID=1613 RepID=UPI0021CB8F29|nr:hypothetical protein [Limosilactobacillus fermentum]